MYDKYLNGKKDDYYYKDKYLKEKYMGIYSNYYYDVYLDNKYFDGYYMGYCYDKYFGGKYLDRYYKGFYYDKYLFDYFYDKKYIRFYFYYGRLGGIDLLVEFGFFVFDVGRGIWCGGFIGLFDDVVGVLGCCLWVGGFFLGFIFDYLVGIVCGLFDVGLFSLLRRYGYIYLFYKGNDYDNKYFYGF